LNLDALIEHARQQRGDTDRSPLLLKVYVRNPNDFELIRARLRERFAHDEVVFLAADICRRELLLEIECVLTARAT
jgi:chorismate lyase/3-hydroxybenzoate synthase